MCQVEHLCQKENEFMYYGRFIVVPPFFYKRRACSEVFVAHFLDLQSVDTLFSRIDAMVPLGTETLPLEQVFNRVLAEDFLSPEDLPGFNRSSMDGFAVVAKDVFGASEGLPAYLAYKGECPMGETPDIRIEPGETARIWTGGMLPEGADAVVMLEYSRQAGEGHIELMRPAAPGENVIFHDEDAEKGEVLIPRGSILRPQEIGLLAALGQGRITVRKQPRVAIISSGDEVVPLGEMPRPGQVRDVNSYTLAALVMAGGGIPVPLGLVGDSPQALQAMVTKGMEIADVVLVSGGSSAGQRDYTVQSFKDVGATVVTHGVAISPGKPLILAQMGQKSLWGLPGHVASALICAEVFIRRLLKVLLGQRDGGLVQHGTMQALLSRPIASAQGRRDYIRVSLTPPAEKGGLPIAVPILGKSGLISTLVSADALIVCPESAEGLLAGQEVTLLPLN